MESNQQRKEVYEQLAQHNIFLPKYQLAKIMEELEQGTELEEIVCRVELKEKYHNRKKGAYLLTDEKRRHPIQRLDVNTGEVLQEYDSIYAAAKWTGAISRASTICQALNQPNRSALGYAWATKI